MEQSTETNAPAQQSMIGPLGPLEPETKQSTEAEELPSFSETESPTGGTGQQQAKGPAVKETSLPTGEADKKSTAGTPHAPTGGAPEEPAPGVPMELSPTIEVKPDHVKEEPGAASTGGAPRVYQPLSSTGGHAQQAAASSGAIALSSGGTASDAAPSPQEVVPMDQDWISEMDPDENLALSLWPADSVSDVVPVMEKHLELARKIEESIQQCTHSERPVAAAIAGILRTFGVIVKSTHHVGADIPVLDQEEVDTMMTRTLYHTRSEKEEEVTEYVEGVHGKGSTMLLYQYKQTPMVAADGNTQLRCYLPKHRSKPGTFTMTVDSTVGTWATRFDSLISHLCVMKGFPDSGGGVKDPKLDFDLPPGRLAPAVYTDEQVRAAGYCYGTLAAVPDSGDGHWTPPSMPAGNDLALLKEILAKGITTVLHGRAFIAGPKAGKKSFSQWAKNGFIVHSALVRGCVIPERVETFARASFAHLENKRKFLRELSRVSSSPWSFIQPSNQAHLLAFRSFGTAGTCLKWMGPILYGMLKREVLPQTISNKIAATWGHYIRDDSWQAEPLHSCIASLILHASAPDYRKWKCEKTGAFFTTAEVIGGKADHVESMILDYSCDHFLSALMTAHYRCRSLLGQSESLPSPATHWQPGQPLIGTVAFDVCFFQTLEHDKYVHTGVTGHFKETDLAKHGLENYPEFLAELQKKADEPTGQPRRAED